MDIKQLFDILMKDKPSIDLLNKEEQLFELIPELEKCKGFNQNNEWHIYDVYEHILHVVDNVPRNIALRLASLFHDIGKPESYTEDSNGIGHFYGHWETSKNIFEEFSKKHDLNKDLSKLVSNLIYYHDINIDKLEDIEVFNIDEIKMLYELKKADLLAQNKKYHYILNYYDKQEKKLIKSRWVNESGKTTK